MLFEDQIGHSFKLNKAAHSIVSLVPSQTELLYDLGLGDQVVGITKFCVHPKAWYQSKARVGGTKEVDFEKVAALAPTIIIGNKEENTQSTILALQKLYPVYTSDIKTIADVLGFIQDLGELFGVQEKAKNIGAQIQDELAGLKQISGRIIYLIWKNPYMGVGQNTFIAHMLNLVGLRVVNLDDSSRYPSLTENEITQLEADYIFLSSEPFPFAEKHILELQKISNANIVLVDGELFSWYGSRLLLFKAYWEHQLLPQLEKTKLQ